MCQPSFDSGLAVPTPEDRKERRDRRAREVEQSQKQLRDSIAETQKYLDASDEMLKRHRRECDEEG
jgi:hypothetical protein